MGAETESLARALRDLEAAKARVERDAQLAADTARKQLVEQLLPVLDDIDRTIRSAEDADEAPAIVEGAKLVRTRLESVLRGFGVERVDAINERFDPALHDAVGLIDVREPGFHDVVIDQERPCYRFGKSLLRPARVIVGRCTVASPFRVSSGSRAV